MCVCLCVCLSLHLSATSQCCTETFNHKITWTTPHDSPGSLVSVADDLGKNQTRSHQMELITRYNSKKSTVASELLTEFGRKFFTSSVHLSLQHDCRDAVRRAGSSATADTCLISDNAFAALQRSRTPEAIVMSYVSGCVEAGRYWFVMTQFPVTRSHHRGYPRM